MSRPWRIGCVGSGGYAASLMGAFNRVVDPERARLTVVAALDREEAEANPDVRAQGARVVGSLEEMLATGEVDAVLLPTSIDSHEPYTRQALAAGVHVLCEKPVAGTVQEVEAMIEARDRAGRVVAVGYQDLYSKSLQWAKRQIMAGAIGKVRRGRVWATLPRTDSYYQRNDWAGAVKRGERFVLDSPANNALAHQVNMLLYLAGETLEESAEPMAVEAELYRARSIENYDTGAIRCRTGTRCQMLMLLTHACAEVHQPEVEIEGETGVIRRVFPDRFELRRGGAVVDACANDERGTHGAMFDNFLDRLDGRVERVCCELENGRAQTLLINGVSACTPVVTVPCEQVDRKQTAEGPGGEVEAIRGIEALWAACSERFELPHETGLAAWTEQGGEMAMTGYERFTGVAAGR